MDPLEGKIICIPFDQCQINYEANEAIASSEKYKISRGPPNPKKVYSVYAKENYLKTHKVEF